MRILCMSFEASWEKGNAMQSELTMSGFGEVYVAMDKAANELVAIKRIKGVSDDRRIENETQLLKECQSRYIVLYYNMIRKGEEWWVSLALLGNEADCDGVLPLWFDSSDLTKWYSTNGRRTEGDCELLSAGLILPS